MTTLFARFDEDRSNEVKVGDDMTWYELSEEFFAFLQGCGYVLSRADFAEYWAQYLEDQKYDADADGCCGGCHTQSDVGAQVFDNMRVDLTNQSICKNLE